jgi:uncharacterized repeat protein (TIGR02543 family)
MSAFGSGPSNGQFWFGGSTFPGFLYKKNLGVGARRSTKMAPGGNVTCNSETYLYNKYKPGGGGVGASSTATRRAKNRLATVCSGQQCFPCYNTLGQYSNYTHNPNGFVPCPAIASSIIPTPSPSVTYTVTYNGNNGTGTLNDTNSPYTSGSTVTVLGNTFTRTSFTFAGWNTAANGSGTPYSPTNTFTINANTILYAQWTPVAPTTYTVTYNGNTNTSGTAPTDGSSPYTAGSTVTVLGNTGSPVLAKTSYQFAGWNTAADGSGTNYVGGNTFTINANTTLYANWLITGSPRLIYNANSAAGGTGTAPSSSNTSYPPYSSVDIVGNTGSFTNSDPTKTFGGWNTAANGSGTYYPAGSEISLPALGAVTLYAQWINSATSYTLTYNGNGSTGGALPSSSGTSYFAGSPANIVGNTGNLTNGSLVFYGWNTATDGTGTSYPAGSNINITMNANKTLYAQWVSASPQYTVTYDANGATGGSVPAAPTNYPSGVQVPILGEGSLTRPGYTFLGWNGSSSGTGSIYAPGFTFTSKTATLYANWAPGSPVKYCGGGGSGGSAGSPSVTIQYYFPIAQIILSTSTNTITVYTTALLSATASNYGTGTAPLGITSIASKTVITSTNITINTNTSYLISADYNYSKTITNGVDANYWPSGATISSITYSTLNPSNSSIPTYNISTKSSFNGCGLSANVGSSGSAVTAYSFYNQTFTVNFSNGASTFIANSPTNTLYTATTSPAATWVTAPTDRYPYQNIQDSYNALTAITIIPSGGSTYVSPDMPATTVQYDGNGNTSGSPPNPQYFGSYTGGTPTSITLRTNSGVLAKTGVTFSGWNTQADGTGTDYAVSATYSGTASLILYAKWL